MPVLVYSVVRRHMKRTGRFVVFDTGCPIPTPVHVSMLPGETMVGWYRNPPPWENCWVVFTSEAIYMVDETRVERLALSEIVDYEEPRSKVDATGVRVRTRHGFRFVRIAGCHGPGGQFKDVYNFIMAIRGLIPVDPAGTRERNSPTRK
jgi:hypothetical protein